MIKVNNDLLAKQVLDYKNRARSVDIKSTMFFFRD